MPDITFSVDHLSQLVPNNNGGVEIHPALPATGRLYVIWSTDHQRQAYVGTSSDVQARFGARIAALNEMAYLLPGVNAPLVQPAMQGPLIFTVQINIDGQDRLPNDTGRANGIDVEHLLLRIYYLHYQFGLRNTVKWNAPFQNAKPSALRVKHVDPHGLVHGFTPLGLNAFVHLAQGYGNY